MYNKVPTNLNFVEREKETEKFWKENYADDVLEQIVNPIEKKIEEMVRNRQ